MAERRPVRERESAPKASRRPLTAAEAARYGLRHIAELTGKDVEGVAGVEPAEDGWLVTVDVVEDHRIPSSTDVLASYEAELGPDGGLVAYRRVKRYARGRGDDGGDTT
jgi:Gas vesicle synthesis protein GvpO